jgi:hypothetical protein
MAKDLDPHEAGAAREDARRLEAQAVTGEPYPDGTVISRPNQASRMFDVRLSEEQFAAIQEIAESQQGKTPVCTTWCPSGGGTRARGSGGCGDRAGRRTARAGGRRAPTTRRGRGRGTRRPPQPGTC